ncbi:Phenylacetic acid degradation-related protein [Rhodopseudomonas palustris BisB5]|uniref:Phenylacetic acid degradation-related protein n=1 Tax=Rhodopseudomonas palustris (strain BisB5) TaxID=316057 RepID=Q139X1_RHOPS|nr:Phenylacetic acid degradation-related protein [Rhodopseudomonas palustris BisB5]
MRSNAGHVPDESNRMTDTTSIADGIPAGFVRHTRASPLTAPWEPLYAMITDDAVIIGLRIAAPHTNSRGLAHGGLITALADNAMGLSCGLKLGGCARLLTAGLSIDFIGPAKVGQWLQIEPEVIKLGGTLCVAQCFITVDGERCARANGTFSVVKPKG